MSKGPARAVTARREPRSVQIASSAVVVGTTDSATNVGRRSVFGHRGLVIGATIGDLCEIGNASILMPGARVGDRVFLGEGTLVPADGDRSVPPPTEIDGFPALEVARIDPPGAPAWALSRDDLLVRTRGGRPA